MTDEKARTKDPAYRVFVSAPLLVDAALPREESHGLRHLTPKGPVKAPSRTDAIKQAISDLGDAYKPRAGDAYLVIKESEYQMFHHRVETKHIDLWEPLPADPSALSVPTPKGPSAQPED